MEFRIVTEKIAMAPGSYEKARISLYGNNLRFFSEIRDSGEVSWQGPPLSGEGAVELRVSPDGVIVVTLDYGVADLPMEAWMVTPEPNGAAFMTISRILADECGELVVEKLRPLGARGRVEYDELAELGRLKDALNGWRNAFLGSEFLLYF